MYTLIAELRQLYEEQRYSEAWEKYNECKDDESEWQLYGSLTAWKSGNIVSAIHIIERALYQRKQPTGEVSLKCHFQYGDMQRRMGSLSEAIQEFDHCKRLLLGDASQMYSLLYGATLYNLGLCFSGMGDHRQAMAYYLRALQPFRDEHMSIHECMCLQNMAWTHIDTGNYVAAYDCIYSARVLGHNPFGDDALRAYLEFRRGNFSDATILCETLLRQADNGEPVPIEVDTIARVVFAEVGFSEGHVQEALAIAQSAVMLSLEQTEDVRCFRLAKMAYHKINTAIRAGSMGIDPLPIDV